MSFMRTASFALGLSIASTTFADTGIPDIDSSGWSTDPKITGTEIGG